MNKIKQAFGSQKQGAKRRGIEFFFTFEEWVKWWVNQLGPDWFEMRGRKRGQYVMARIGDKGDYHPDNVRCITTEQNGCDKKINKSARKGPGLRKLDRIMVIAIFTQEKTYTDFKKLFGVSKGTVWNIKSKRSWTSVTKRLTLSPIIDSRYYR